MDLKEFNSGAGAPLTKPWLTPVVFSLEAGSILTDSLVVNGRVVQEKRAGGDGHLTPYSLWRCLGDLKCSGTTLVFAMGSFLGPVLIPASSCYRGMAVKVKVAGLLTTTGANTTTFSIQNLAGDFVHASQDVSVAAMATDRPIVVEFVIQIGTLGGAGVGIERFGSEASMDLSSTVLSNAGSNSTTFSSTGGVEYYLYIQHDTAGSAPSFLRQLAYAVIEA